MRTRPSAARILEAAYRWTESERDWLAGIVDAAKGFDPGGGVVGYTVDLSAAPHVAAFTSSGDSGAGAREPVERLTASFTRGLAERVYAPTEFPGNCAWRIERLARASSTTRSAIEKRGGRAVPPMWAVISGDPKVRAAVLGLLSRSTIASADPFPHRARARQLGLVGAHIGAALRLRGEIGPPSPEDDSTEAVVSPSGAVLHAKGDAIRAAERIALAVRRSERARLRDVPDDEAVELWRALVDGRWSIVDIVERDGKRLVLARRNPLRGKDVAALTREERDVAWLASMGHSNKYIAYELGLTLPTVIRRLTCALRKLGVPTRRDLIRFFSNASTKS
jgi:DNA-binding CsgD family transcriptional regulator